jgi:hypothetical protein
MIVVNDLNRIINSRVRQVSVQCAREAKKDALTVMSAFALPGNTGI